MLSTTVLQRRQLRAQAGLVFGNGIGKQQPLLSGHDLGPGIELPTALQTELLDLDPRQG